MPPTGPSRSLQTSPQERVPTLQRPINRAGSPSRLIRTVMATPMRRALLITVAWQILVAVVSVAAYYVMPRGALQSYSPIFTRE